MKGNSNDGFTSGGPEALFKLNLSLLQPGDVILTATPDYQSRIIRAVTGGDFSHAILVVKHPNAVEASDFGVVQFRLDRFVARDRKNVRVLRVKGPKPKDFERTVIRFAGAQTAKEYADYDVLTALFSRVPRFETRRFFCSQLVATCLKEVKVSGFEQIKPEKVSPETLASSDLFFDVENALVEVDGSSLAFRPAYFDGRNGQSPNERFTNASQRVVKAVLSIFEKHGCDIASLEDALTGLAKLHLEDADFIVEVDQALHAAMVHNRIAEIGRDCWPSNSDEFFIDFIVRNAIVAGGIDAVQQKNLLDFYSHELAIASETLRERDEFITAAKAAYLVSGLESIRYYLAGCWDFYLMHRRVFLTIERAVKILRMQLNMNETALD